MNCDVLVTLIAYEKALHQPTLRADKKTLLKSLHPEFIEIGEFGTSYDLQSITEQIQSDIPPSITFHSQDYQVRELAVNAYLLIYKTARKLPSGEYTHYVKRSSIWAGELGNRQLTYHRGKKCLAFFITA